MTESEKSNPSELVDLNPTLKDDTKDGKVIPNCMVEILLL